MAFHSAGTLPDSFHIGWSPRPARANAPLAHLPVSGQEFPIKKCDADFSAITAGYWQILVINLLALSIISIVGQYTWVANKSNKKNEENSCLFSQTCIFFPLAANGRRNPRLSSRNLFHQPLIPYSTSMANLQLQPGWEVLHVTDLLVDITSLGLLVNCPHVLSTYTQCGWNSCW